MNTDQQFKNLKEYIITGDIEKIVNETLAAALGMSASDIHIEPRKNLVQIRYRLDGILQEIIEYPINIHPGIISKLKLMSQLKIDESRIPQDGRLTTTIGVKDIDLRVSTLPTVHGEKVVMRIVDKSKKIPKLEELGITGENYRRIIQGIKEPNGIVLTSGPTGSGKTTTMYSAMAFLNKPEVNIMTLEDPVENQMDGLNQSQIKPDINYTFASGLRTALRQDPDIIMVGEIRDKETIDIAIEASLTGHLVLSTIHTNSSIETITRILNMKVADFLLSSSINAIIAQRLARKLCKECCIPIKISKEAEQKISKSFEIFSPYPELDMSIFNNPKFLQANTKGCEKCSYRGYNGRVGLYEVLTMNDRMRDAINKREPSLTLEKIAKEDGMITLEQDGIIKVMQGITSLEEVYKLVKEKKSK
jgi:type IV pilus assembly protein PilB